MGASHLFCTTCGFKVDDPAPSEREPHPSERKLVTVLFADIVGSTALVEGMDPEDAGEVIGPLIEAMRAGVNRYEGVVNQVEGDGIMALFGAPVADEHHAIGGCFAAIDIPRLVKSVDPEVDVRVGVHSGEVLVRSEDRDLSSDYVASGPTVHLASRLEQAARPGIPLVSSDTANLASGNVRVGPPALLAVRGFDDPIEVRELLGKGDGRGSLQARMARRLTDFVARRDELRLLSSKLTEVEGGFGSVVSVVGGPGVGKSRLLHEFINRLDEQVRVLTAQASPYDRSTPYRPIAEMMRSFLARRGGGPYNVEETLEGLDPSLTTYSDAMVALIGGDPSAAWMASDAGLRRQTTRRAIRATLGAAAAEALLVVVLEDLHWMDNESLSVIDELVDLAEATPLLMVTSQRPEHEMRWGDLAQVTVLQLEGLMGTDVADFVDVLVGTRSSTSTIRAELTERTDGTPLFLEEMVRSLADDGVLTGEPGRYKRGGSDMRIEMPAGVQAVIASRIDRLPLIAKEVLQLVAVHGEEVRGDLLDVTSDRNERELSEALDQLATAEMLFEDASTHPSTYTFKHNLIREVAYTSIPNKRREALHARIAEGVIAIEFEDDWTERLAHHTFEAGQWEDAARFALASAKRAQAKSAYRESERFLSMSLEALALLPKNRANIEQTIDALITRRIATVGIGGLISAGLGELDDAEALANEIGDLERVARVNLHRSYARSMTGQHQPGLLDAERAHGLGQQLGNRRLTAEANLAKAQHYAYAGQPAPVVGLLDRDLSFLRDEVGRNGMLGHRVVWAHIHITVAQALSGEFTAARQSASDAMTLARDRGLALDEVNAHWAAAVVELWSEHFKKAVEYAAEAADLAAAHEFTWIGNLNEIVRGYALGRLGGFDEAVEILDRAVETGEHLEVPMHVAWAKAYLAELMTACGQNEVARDHAQEALRLARRHDLPAVEVMGLQMLGRAQPRLAKARAFFDEGLSLAGEHSLRPQSASIRSELAWVLSEMGEQDEGAALLEQANRARSDMGLTVIEIPGL